MNASENSTEPGGVGDDAEAAADDQDAGPASVPTGAAAEDDDPSVDQDAGPASEPTAEAPDPT